MTAPTSTRRRAATDGAGSGRATPPLPADAVVRAVVEGVSPQVDGGRFPAKREVGDTVVVEADVFADGHDIVAARLRWRHEDDTRLRAAPMEPVGNDRWRGSFAVDRPGTCRFLVEGGVDRFATWQHRVHALLFVGRDVSTELPAGAALLAAAARQTDSAFHLEQVDNDQIIAYSGALPERTNRIVVVVNLGWWHRQSGWVQLDLGRMGLSWDSAYAVTDLLTGTRYDWVGARHFVILDPAVVPAHVLRMEFLSRRGRS